MHLKWLCWAGAAADSEIRRVSVTAPAPDELPPLGLRLCRGVDKIPVYVINTDDKPARLEYNKQLWGADGFTRIRGVDGRSSAELASHFGGEIGDADLGEPDGGTAFVEAWKEFSGGARPGESACLAGHLSALATALADGFKHVLIFEDDVGIQLCPLWSMRSLQVLIDEANLKDPSWELIRLQWQKPSEDQYADMRAHLELVKALVAGAPTGEPLFGRYGNWTAQVPTLARCSGFRWGAAANLWSRTGLLRQVRRAARSGAGDGPLWDRAKLSTLHVDEGLLQPAVEHCFNSQPGLFAPRFAEDFSGIRGKNPDRVKLHHDMHFKSFLRHVTWFGQLLELGTQIGHRLLPLKDLEIF